MTGPPVGYGAAVLYQVLKVTAAPVLRIAYRPEMLGIENVPATGPVIIAANHLSVADEVFTPLAAGRQVHYLAKSQYFTTPGAKGWVMAQFFGGMGLVPVDRDVTSAAAASVEVCVEVLRQGKAFGIYPEGTRSEDGRLHKFRTGVARIALRTGAPVVPVGLVGTQHVHAEGQRMWRIAPVSVRFGKPLDFSGRPQDERSARMLREVTEQIRLAVQDLSGQEYVDRYGSVTKGEATA
jgi:1-acyl-sn-glycerol-3-phosphate acyltransferase